jgi:hypothetical protein
MTVLVPEGTDTSPIDAAWIRFHGTDPHVTALHAAGVCSIVHLDIEDATFELWLHTDGGYPDYPEVAIGNMLVYSHPLWMRNDRVDWLRDTWLPYHDEDMPTKRLAQVR